MRFTDFIQKTLHVKVKDAVYPEAEKLPLYLKNCCKLSLKEIPQGAFLAIEPKEKINLAFLRKQWRQLKKLTGLECVFYLDDINSYTKQKLIEEGIPFVIRERQLYLPFLGCMLSNQPEQAPLKNEEKKISFATQKLLLYALYENWRNKTLTEAALALGMSKMTMSRSYSELEMLGLSLVVRQGINRRFLWEKDRRSLWKVIEPFMRKPVCAEYHFGVPQALPNTTLGGMSALSFYSALEDNEYRTYAVTRETAKRYLLHESELIPEGEPPAEVIQVFRYEIPYGSGLAVDPITAALSLSESEREDPRVERAIDDMMEAVFDGERD